MRPLRASPVVLDGVLAVTVTAVELAGAWAASRRVGEPALTTAGVGLLVVRGCALAFARRHPYVVGVVASVATALYGVAELPDPAVPLAPLVALVMVVLASTRRVALVITALVVTGSLVATGAAGDSDAADYYLAVFGPALAWAVGEMERNRRARVDEAVARGAADERARIARELHDVVAHHVSVMVVQAEAGASVAGAGDRVGAAFDSIAGTGRAALAELRRLLSGWRPEADASSSEPQPGLERLDALAAGVRDAGVHVDVSIEGDQQGVPPGVDVSAYRIVQEALTNVVKHAGPAARATVVVRCGAAALDITVTDDGRGGRSATNGDGHGLTGIRERVAMFGGDVRAGARPAGGFEVAARLPYDV